jgi:6-phosphofructo-2-kinase
MQQLQQRPALPPYKYHFSFRLADSFFSNPCATDLRAARSQSQQSALARTVMANQPVLSASPKSAASVPRSVPEPDSGRYATTPVSLETSFVSNPNHAAQDAQQHSPTESTSSKASSDAMGPPLIPPPAPAVVAHKPPPHPASIANALRAVRDGTHGQLPLRERPPPAQNESPYTKSISSTAPASPRIPPLRQNSGTQTPRVRPHATTLNIPGMTKSTISPDGRIADRDVAAKLVIIMVGLPARGKSYITKKIKRYLSWQQHNTRIFNVGNRRRVAVGVSSPVPKPVPEGPMDAHAQVAKILLNGNEAKLDSLMNGKGLRRGGQEHDYKEPPEFNLDDPNATPVDQSANFFNPKNAEASKIREQLAIDTLDELLDYLLVGGGAVGILDATNSTLERRQRLFDHIKEREPRLGILFIESVCQNPDVS